MDDTQRKECQEDDSENEKCSVESHCCDKESSYDESHDIREIQDHFEWSGRSIGIYFHKFAFLCVHLVIRIGELPLGKRHRRGIPDTVRDTKKKDDEKSVEYSKKEHRYSGKENSREYNKKRTYFFREGDKRKLRSKSGDCKQSDENISGEKSRLKENIIIIRDNLIEKFHKKSDDECIPETEKNDDDGHNHKFFIERCHSKNFVKRFDVVFRGCDDFFVIHFRMKLHGFQKEEFHPFRHLYKIGFLHLGDGVLLDGFYGFSRRNNLEFFDVGDVEIERDFRIVEIHDYESDKQNYEENENRNGDKYIESQYNSR